MKKVLLILAVLCSIRPLAARAGDIIVVQSARISAYNSALAGFTATVLKDIPARGLKSVQAHTITSYILTETQNPGQLRQEIIRQRPDLILVIGSSSLALVKGIGDIPIIYLMVPYPELIIKDQENVTGVNIDISAEQQLQALIRTIPRIRTIGLLYDPDHTGDFVRDAEIFVKKNNRKLVALPVKTAKEVPGQLARLSNVIDCYWMLPDRTVITPLTLDHILLFSLENRIPVLTFSEKYLELGAVLSVSFDSKDMGIQAGEMAMKLLNHAGVADVPPAGVRRLNVRANHLAAKVLGIELEQLQPAP